MTDPASSSSPDPSRTPDPAHSRVGQVFISSTFRDFGAERDLLMKRVLPELRIKDSPVNGTSATFPRLTSDS